MSDVPGLRVDRTSLLVDVAASTTLEELRAALAPLGLTPAIERSAGEGERATVGQWLAAGAPGARDVWLDPADHLVAGFEAELADGRTLVVRPSPRRAMGPDLVALVTGARGRFVTLRRVWLRVHDSAARLPQSAPFRADRDPPVSPAEERLLDAIARELGVSSFSSKDDSRSL
jgi:alkyldihydroxyacetonephosphate synthase